MEHLDSLVNGYIKKWLDISMSGTLSNVFLERIKFDLNICPPSVKLNFYSVLNSSPKIIP